METSGVDTKIIRGEHQWVKEFREDGIPQSRKLYKVDGLCDNTTWGVHNNSFVNVRRGLMERVYFVERQGKLQPCPTPDEGVFKRLYTKVGHRLVGLCGTHSPIPRSQYPGMFQGRKKTIYANAVESLSEMPYTRKDSNLKTFVKCEKLNFSKKPDPAPRVIQPRSPRYNVELGRYLKPVEHGIYKAIDNLWGGPTVMKSYTVEQMGGIISRKWAQFQEPAAIGFDMSRFDQHVSVDALKFEHKIYRKMFCDNPELAMLLSHQLESTGVAFAKDGRLHYRVKGKRMSGDVNTSLGNIILACCITKLIMKDLGVKCELINNGDDCVVFCEARHVQRVEDSLAQMWLSYGFTCICEPTVRTLEKVEFCQMSPVMVGGEYKMVRNPRTSLSKDAHSTVPFETTKVASEWLHAVGTGGIALTSGVPVIQEYYQCMIRNGCKGRDKKMQHFLGDYYWNWVKSHHGRYCDVDDESRHSFHLAFGISPDQQVALEEYYRTLDLNMEFAPFSNNLAIVAWILEQKIPI